MELLQLRYFLEAARSQHMTRTAEKLHIAQPSLTQSIKRLERELGVKLFVPQGRNIALTEQGRFLQEKLEPILDRLDALPEQLRALSDPEQTTIRLHVTAASRAVSEAIIAYRREHRKVNFQFLLSEDAHLFDLRIEGRPSGAAVQEDAFHLDERIYLAVPDAPAYAGLERVRLADFRDANFISLIAQKQFRQTCDRFCAEAGFAPRIAFESDSPETVRNMIAAHMGVGFWPAFTWGALGGDGMKLLDIAEPECRRSIVIQMRKNRIDARIVEHFYHFLCDWFTRQMHGNQK